LRHQAAAKDVQNERPSQASDVVPGRTTPKHTDLALAATEAQDRRADNALSPPVGVARSRITVSARDAVWLFPALAIVFALGNRGRNSFLRS